MGILSWALVLSTSAFQIMACDDPSNPEAWQFIGCRPTASECRWSCPDKAFRTEWNPNLCEFELEPWACYCPKQD